MTPTTITLSQVVRFLRAQAPSGGSLYIRSLVRGLETRYGFLQSPNKLEDYDISKGLTFLHGEFQGRFVIDRFQVFENGILTQSKVETETLEEFVGDAANWAQEELGLKVVVPETGAKRNYVSNVVFKLDFEINEKFQKFSGVASAISQFLRSYGTFPQAVYGVNGLSMYCDLTAVPTPQPVAFTFERRAGQPFSENLYFSSAPLTTSHHFAVLEMMETILRSDAT